MRLGQHPIEVLPDHVRHPAGRVAKGVGQICVVGLRKQLSGKRRVGRAQRAAGGQKVAQGVEPERVHTAVDRLGIQKVPQRLTHLLAAVADPVAVAVDLRRQVHPRVAVDLAQRHQHRWPHAGVEPQDVLGDEVRRAALPVVPPLGRVHIGQVVEQRIDPHVDRLLFIAGHRDAPAPGAGAADGHVLGFFDAVDDLVTPRVGLYKTGVRLKVGQQRRHVVREPEEVVLLGFLHQRLAVDLALVVVVLGLVLRHVLLLARVVPPLVLPLVHVAAF